MAMLQFTKTRSVFSRLLTLKTSTAIGFAVAILSAALSSLPDVVSKPIVDPGVNGIAPIEPLMVVFIMYLATGLFFTPITKLQKSTTPIKKSSYVILIIYGVASACSTLAFSFGLKETSATNASILSNSEIVFTVLIGMILFKEYLAKKEILPFVLIAAGAILLPIGSDIYEHRFAFSEFVFGDIMVVISGFIYCLCTFIAKHAGNVKTTRVVQIMSLSGALFCFAMMLVFQTPFTIDLSALPILSFVGIAGIGGSVLFFVMAVRLIGAVRTILIFSSATVFGVIYSAIYLLESIDLFTVSSLGIVTIGLYRLRYKLAA
ncbi:MAG TPA: DMT family transporter [Candidatus Nitrosotenuis sp.]